tara:strand:- start:5021 stop:5251 length:231 start_codon:yes stop_codon:yes gene_type:complete
MTKYSITYSTYLRLKNYNEYEFTKCSKCFNGKTGRQINKVSTKSGCIGFNIRGKFMSLKKLRPLLEKLPINEKTPF